MKLATVVGAVLGLALARMAYLMFDVPEKNCSLRCPVKPPFWPWGLWGVLAGAATSVALTLWFRRLRRANE